MRLSAVTTCISLGHVLAKTLRHNAALFDELIVVTDQEDSLNLPSAPGVRVVRTSAFYSGGQAFNKGAGINVGFAMLDRPEWVVHLDCDIVVNPLLRGTVLASCDQRAIYRPLRRLFIPDETLPPYGNFSLQRRDVYVRPSDPLTALGWFQFFHVGFFSGQWPRVYPEAAKGAGTDTLFHWKFPRTLYFQWNCLHLGFAYGGLRFCGHMINDPVAEQSRLEYGEMEDT